MTAAGGTTPLSPDLAASVLDYVHGARDDFVAFLAGLCECESPTNRPETQTAVQDRLTGALADLHFDVRRLPGRGSGGHLYARPSRRRRGAPAQLLVGHTDTVWPVGTLETMPVREDDGRLYGPGTLDMKGGLTQMVFALRALRDLGLEPPATPVLFVNSDEETGSPDSKRWIRRMATRVRRAFVLEPALAPDARIKTARKGIGRFDVIVRGKASHAGLDPDAGASAILELAYVIRALDSLQDGALGRTLNVGVIEGGIGANVVAPLARAAVDARVTTVADARALEEAVAAIEPTVAGVSLEISGGVIVPPLERTPRNRALWEQARGAGAALGFDLEEGMAGGGSDGNTTSLYTATLDGLGCVGDGPHAAHEHIEIRPTLDRCALLACLLMMPVDDASGSTGGAAAGASE